MIDFTEEETERMIKSWRQKTFRSIEILNRLKEEDKMNSIQDSYLKSLNPSVSVKVTELNGKKIPEQIVKDIHATLTYKYNTFLDKENGVIYVGRRI